MAFVAASFITAGMSAASRMSSSTAPRASSRRTRQTPAKAVSCTFHAGVPFAPFTTALTSPWPSESLSARERARAPWP